MTARGGERMLGPYAQPKGWRVIEVDEAGNRSSIMFPTEEEARQHKIEGKRVRSATAKPQQIKNRDGSTSWRIRVVVDGKQVGSTFPTRELAEIELDRLSALRLQPHGLPVTFHVTAIYANGARRDVAAVSLTNDSGYLPGVGYQTDDGEFLIFVARAPAEHTEEWQFDPETDIPQEGVPF